MSQFHEEIDMFEKRETPLNEAFQVLHSRIEYLWESINVFRNKVTPILSQVPSTEKEVAKIGNPTIGSSSTITTLSDFAVKVENIQRVVDDLQNRVEV